MQPLPPCPSRHVNLASSRNFVAPHSVAICGGAGNRALAAGLCHAYRHGRSSRSGSFSDESQPKAAGTAMLAGIGLMLAGMFLFSINDAMGKWLVASYSVGRLF